MKYPKEWKVDGAEGAVAVIRNDDVAISFTPIFDNATNEAIKTASSVQTQYFEITEYPKGVKIAGTDASHFEQRSKTEEAIQRFYFFDYPDKNFFSKSLMILVNFLSVESVDQYGQEVDQILSTFRFIEPLQTNQQNITARCEKLLNQASSYYPPYESKDKELAHIRQNIMQECVKYLDKTCNFNQECGPFPCNSGLCLIKPCNADSQCPSLCGLNLTPVPRFCTTTDIK